MVNKIKKMDKTSKGNETVKTKKADKLNRVKAKLEITRQVAQRMGINHKEASEIIQLTLDSIVALLFEDRRVELRGFGTFEIKVVKNRGLNLPHIKEMYKGKKDTIGKIVFKPGRDLKAKAKTITE